MNTPLDSIINPIRAALRLPAEASSEARRFVIDLLPGSASGDLQLVGALCADLAEIRHGAIGLSWALEGIQDLVSACCVILDIEQPTEMYLLDLVNEFGRHLFQSSRNDTRFSVLPSKKDNVLIYFFAQTRKEVLGERGPDDESERWRVLCYLGYLGTRIGLDSSVATQQITGPNESSASYGRVDHQAMESARAVELFIKYAPLHGFEGQFPTVVAPELIEHTIIGIARHAEGIRRFETAKRYQKWAHALLSRSFLHRGRRSTGVIKKPQPRNKVETSLFTCDQVDRRMSNSDIRPSASLTKGVPGVDDFVWTETKTTEIEEGGSPHEYAPPLPPSAALSLRAGLSERARLFIPLGRVPIWDSSVLTQETLGTILAYVINRTSIEAMDAYQLGIFCFVITQVHFGFSSDRLSRAKIKNSSWVERDRNLSPLIYEPEQGRFDIYPQGHDGSPVFGHAPLHDDGFYLSGSHSFTLAVPTLVRRLLNRFLSLAPRVDNSLFTFLGKDGEPLAINTETVNAHLQPLKHLIREKIEANRLGRSALIHLTAYGRNAQGNALDELLMAFISGFIPRQWAAQAHYVNLPVSRIQADYLYGIKHTFERLCEVSRLQIESLGVGNLNCLNPFFTTEPKADDTAPQPIEVRFGSPFVPRQEDARNYLHTLRSSLEGRADPYLRFNRLTGYIALVMMFVTGMRPVELATLTEERVWPSKDESEATLCLRSKPNKTYEEWRALLLPFPFGSLLKTYREEVTSLLELMWREGGTVYDLKQCRRDSFFFFVIGQRRRLIPLSTAYLRTVLREESETHLRLPAFLWRMNSPRHFFSSTAAGMGIPRILIDILMGHQTRGREVLGRYSLTLYEEVLQAARQISGVIARQLAIEPLAEQQV